MNPAERDPGADNRPDGLDLLVCVYYRVDAADAARAIATVREFQRTLARRHPGLGAEVLLRWELPIAELPTHALSEPSALPVAASDVDAESDPARHRDAPVTVMETYRLASPESPASPAARAVAGAFLDELAATAVVLDAMLRGARHVELFASCAS